ncbi:lysoplasmalogenase [Actinospica durhamensis]|uniref:Lysoplasmalogenase n=1 Tax=Actinospica durhamensis TaxID=1508375 RepID=A0A941IT01_9ACTN|nr:lysoplasmalogenase [Actinospica durhamensis]MBR7837012.1 lysoplasmalogenase [Actinospica durhamensis]
MSAPAAVSAPSTPLAPWTRFAMPAFLLVGALNLLFEAAGPHLGYALTKPLLMLLLLAAAAAAGTRRRSIPVPGLLVGALVGSFVGDTMLLFSGTLFLVGMAGFACAHVCYIRLFLGRARLHPRRLRGALATYGVIWVVLISSLWSGLDSSMRIPVACYSLLLAGMATTSYGASRRTGLGGALFLLSDSMIAAHLAHWSTPTGTGFAVMATYLVGQYLLTTGVLALASEG